MDFAKVNTVIKPNSAPVPGMIDPVEGLQALYCLRTGFSILWVILVSIFTQMDTVEKVLLVLYPAWDVVCTFIDIRVSGNARAGSAQYINCMVSVVTTTLIAFALQESVSATLILFGFWAIITGLIQLIMALKRNLRFFGQWPIIISGVQSMLAGCSFIMLSHVPGMGIGNLATYAAFGAFYYLISAIRLKKIRSTKSFK